MGLETSILDAEFFGQVDTLFGTQTVQYGTRFETLMPIIGEDGRRIDPDRSEKIIASNEPRKVSKRKAASSDAGIHYRIDDRGLQTGRKSDMKHSRTRRDFLRSLMRAQPGNDWKTLSALSHPEYLVEDLVEIPQDGLVIAGRGPENPSFFRLRAEQACGDIDHRRNVHDQHCIIPSFFIDGRDTAAYRLNLYHAGNSLLLVSDSGGFYPTMWHADEIEAALDMKLPGVRADRSTDLEEPRIVRETDRISLLHYTNARPDRNLATRLLVGDAEVRLVPSGDQVYHLTANGTVVAELGIRYSHTKYVIPERPETWEQSYELLPQEISDRGFACCVAEPRLNGLINPNDEEWAASVANYFASATPGMTVKQSEGTVRVQFEPLGIRSRLTRQTSEDGSRYFIKGQEEDIGRHAFVPGYVF